MLKCYWIEFAFIKIAVWMLQVSIACFDMENDGGLDTFKENTKVPYATLFTPRPSHTALFEGLNLHSIK